MALPILEPAPVVTKHAAVFRDVFDNQGQFRHVQPDLTGLIVLPNKSLANRARCILDSPETTNRSRVRSPAPWREDAINHRRIRFRLHQTKPQRRRRRESLVVIDDTLCEQVGSLFDDVDRHDNQSDGTDPLAHNPVTSFSVRGPVRVPLGLRRYRRDEELTQWEAALATHGPELTSPTARQARNRLHTQVAPVLLQDPEFRARHEQFRTKLALASALVAEAIRRKVPFGVVVVDAWYRKDWSSLLTTHRRLETASLHLRDANGWTLKLPGPHLAVEKLVPLTPATAYRPLTGGEHPYWCVTLGVRIPGLGKVRLVVSFAPETLTGRQVVLVTNRRDWSAAKIIRLYVHRWPTDTCDPDGQGQLGCNEYRMRSAEAIGNHGGLVFVASSLLHLTWLPAGPERTQGLIHTSGDACRHQGRALLQHLLRFVHDQLSHCATVVQVFTRVFAKQQGAILV